MLKFELKQITNIQQKFVTAEKSLIFKSHKSYKLPITKLQD